MRWRVRTNSAMVEVRSDVNEYLMMLLSFVVRMLSCNNASAIYPLFAKPMQTGELVLCDETILFIWCDIIT